MCLNSYGYNNAVPPPSRVDPLSAIFRAAAAAGREKVSLNWLKIAKQVANG